MSKIGKRLCITVGTLLLICTFLITVTSSLIFYIRNETVMANEEKTNTNVLNNRMDALYATVDSIADSIYDNEVFQDAIINKNIQTAIDSIKIACGKQAVFAILSDDNNNVLYCSSDFDINKIDMNDLTSGFVSNADNSHISYLSVKKPYTYTLVVGLDMSEPTHIDNIKALTNAEITIFADTTRLSTTIIDEKGNRCVGTQMNQEIADFIKKGKTYTGKADILGEPYECTYYPLMNGDKYIGALFTGTSIKMSNLVMIQAIVVSLGSGIIILTISVIYIIFFVKKRIAKPIIAANELAKQMSLGNLTNELCNIVLYDDEIGSMVQMLSETQTTLASYIKDITAVLNTMASGDFSTDASIQYAGDFIAINEAFNRIEEKLGKTLRLIDNTANDVTAGTAQLACGSQILADGSTKQAASIEELSAAIGEIAEKVQHNTQNAVNANKCAIEAEEKVKIQAVSMADVHTAMVDIQSKSEQIGAIIKTIEDIAFQTNILALNAAVEAARAGDAGKGFAVVADEVRNLASKSEEAAKQTAQIISDTLDSVRRGSAKVEETVAAVQSVTEITQRMGTLVNTIAQASEEQNTAIEQINTGVIQISEVVQENSATAEESAASCEELNGHAKTLNAQILQFKIKRK